MNARVPFNLTQSQSISRLKPRSQLQGAKYTELLVLNTRILELDQLPELTSWR